MMFLLIMSLHAFKCESVTFVFGVPIVIELSQF